MKNNQSTFEIPAIFSCKNAKFTVTIDHDILHSTSGKTFDMAFLTDLGNKLNTALPFKDELTHLNGEFISNDFPIANGWSEGVLNCFTRHDIFNQTHNMGYVEIDNTPLNPAGVTSITFDFVD